ncbi:hypothetical protein ACWD3I_11405 [Streptomyces sp. NPDC002817]|uniref:hypothetical protein n=1 Tax=Streptomyces sp. NPDC088357 TaxID=3154655 RepID=UPI0034310D10
MRSLARMTVVGAIAAAVATATTTAAVAQDGTVYSAGGAQAKVRWVADGDHMYITDQIADGHSAVGMYQFDDTYFYWNREGQGTTRHVNLDLPENRPLPVGAMIGEWEGTATGGLFWNTLSTIDLSTS